MQNSLKVVSSSQGRSTNAHVMTVIEGQRCFLWQVVLACRTRAIFISIHIRNQMLMLGDSSHDLFRSDLIAEDDLIVSEISAKTSCPISILL